MILQVVRKNYGKLWAYLDPPGGWNMPLWLFFVWKTPSWKINAVAQQKCRQSDCEWTIIFQSVLNPFAFYLNAWYRFAGPAFSGYHFQADAHDTWENKNVLLIPKLRLFKRLISRHSTPMKNRVITGIYAVSTPIYAVTFFCMYFYFLDSEWQASWTANNLLKKHAVTGLVKPL